MNEQRQHAAIKGKKRRGGPYRRPRSSELQLLQGSYYGGKRIQAPFQGWMREAARLAGEYIKTGREILRRQFWEGDATARGRIIKILQEALQ